MTKFIPDYILYAVAHWFDDAIYGCVHVNVCMLCYRFSIGRVDRSTVFSWLMQSLWLFLFIVSCRIQLVVLFCSFYRYFFFFFFLFFIIIKRSCIHKNDIRPLWPSRICLMYYPFVGCFSLLPLMSEQQCYAWSICMVLF